MYWPDYQSNSIVNLMSSIMASFGLQNPYAPLLKLSPDELKDARNVILLVLDGLGHEFLKKHGQDTLLWQNTRGAITSVFPPTTSSCTATFKTGLAPQEHAMIGWFMFLKEVGALLAVLPFETRDGKLKFDKSKIQPREIFDFQTIFERLDVETFYMTTKTIKPDDFFNSWQGRAISKGYDNLGGMFKEIGKTIASGRQRKYIFAYWPQIDSLCHDFGVDSSQAIRHLHKIDKHLRSFLPIVKETNTKLIITADHGLIDVPPEKIIYIGDHPTLQACLTLPICSEFRSACCYVRPSKAKQFEDYVKTKLSEYCWLYKSEALVKKKLFGLFGPNAKLFDRIGDYILLMKENYIIRDVLVGEKPKKQVGRHGGISKEEMLVPLIVIS